MTQNDFTDARCHLTPQINPNSKTTQLIKSKLNSHEIIFHVFLFQSFSESEEDVSEEEMEEEEEEASSSPTNKRSKSDLYRVPTNEEMAGLREREHQQETALFRMQVKFCLDH